MLKSYTWDGMGRKSLWALILRAPLCGANNYKYWDGNDVQRSIQAQVGQVEAEFDVIDTGHINRQEISKVNLCTLEFCKSMLHFGGEIKDCSLERDIPWFRRKHRWIPITSKHSLNLLKSPVCLDVLTQLQILWSTIFKRGTTKGIRICFWGPAGHLKCWKSARFAIVLKAESLRKD